VAGCSPHEQQARSYDLTAPEPPPPSTPRTDDTPDTVDGDSVSALSVDFSRTARILFAAGGVDDTLTQVLTLATSTIEGCDFAGILLLDGDAATTPAHTDPVAADLDAFQHYRNEGPCIDAITQKVTIYADDLTGDARWPRFGAEATNRRVRSLLAIPLLADGTPGALTLYAHYPQAFGVIDRARGLLLAALATLAVSSARTHQDDQQREANLHAALVTREIIGQAQGILIERERITGNQAFDILRRASQHLNLKLRQVAQTLVDTGENPDTGSPRFPTP
jgi:transcriptional regulator with GAF, ATPase, and Fis domain